MVVGVEELAGYLAKSQFPYLSADTSGNGQKEVGTLESPDIEVIVSQPVDFKIQEGSVFGYEYRAFIINSKPVHMCVYPTAENENVLRSARNFAKTFAEKNKDWLPPHYVLDIGLLTNDKTYAVVELNPLVHSLGLNRRGMRAILSELGYSRNWFTKLFCNARFLPKAYEVDRLKA